MVMSVLSHTHPVQFETLPSAAIETLVAPQQRLVRALHVAVTG